MKSRRFLLLFASLAVAALAGLAASAFGSGASGRSYVQTNLVSDIPGLAAHTDPNLRNPWGTSVGPGTPTGQAFNTFDPSSPDFVVTNPANGHSGPAFFLFATEDGTISGWNPNVDPTHAVIGVDHSTAIDGAGDVGAVYKGLTLVTIAGGKFLYASNFRFGQVDVFDNHFNLVNSFTDPSLPAGFAPFGIHNIGGNLFVTFAMQDAAKQDDVSRPANGFVDEFAPNGTLIRRFVSRGQLDSPWAVTLAPSTFGVFGGDILVGNFGDGRINAYDPLTGEHLGQLSGASGGPIEIPGLWGLRFAPATPGAGPNTLFFTAGLNDEADGLFGDLVPSG